MCDGWSSSSADSLRQGTAGSSLKTPPCKDSWVAASPTYRQSKPLTVVCRAYVRGRKQPSQGGAWDQSLCRATPGSLMHSQARGVEQEELVVDASCWAPPQNYTELPDSSSQAGFQYPSPELLLPKCLRRMAAALLSLKVVCPARPYIGAYLCHNC